MASNNYVQPELPRELSLDKIKQMFEYFKAMKEPKATTWRLIRSFHSGEFWRSEAVKEKLPNYQILPDTNYAEYVEKAIVNSIYTGNYMPTLMPRTKADEEPIKLANRFISTRWPSFGLKALLPRLGRSVVLYNAGAVQVGWNTSIISNHGYSEQGKVELKYVPMTTLYLDPSITNYKEGRAIFIYRRISIYDMLSEAMLKDGTLAYIDTLRASKDEDFLTGVSDPTDEATLEAGATIYTRTCNLLEAYIRVQDDNGGTRIDHIFIADNKFIIAYQKDIQPNAFPVVVIYGDTPDGDPYGTSVISKLLSNIVTLNFIDSIEATHLYLMQNRPKLVNVRSGINYRTFSKYGNTPHIAFPVHGDPTKVVRYVDMQQLPETFQLKQYLRESIYLVSGVDMRYTGRDTGSVQTTGGMDLQQQRVMSMSDNLRISGLESFIEELSFQILENYRINGTGDYKVVQRNKDRGIEDEQVFNFSKILGDVDFEVSASPYLPKNLMRLSDAADNLMNMQGQFNFQPPLITHEEWLGWKDIPQKDLILDRIRAAQKQIEGEELAADLVSFAGLIEKGMTPEEALQTLVEEKQLKRDNPGMTLKGAQPGM